MVYDSKLVIISVFKKERCFQQIYFLEIKFTFVFLCISKCMKENISIIKDETKLVITSVFKKRLNFIFFLLKLI